MTDLFIEDSSDLLLEDGVTALSLDDAVVIDYTLVPGAGLVSREQARTLVPGAGVVQFGIDSALAKTLGTLTLSSTGDVAVEGTLSKTLGTLTLSSSGELDYNDAALDQTLGALTLSSAVFNGEFDLISSTSVTSASYGLARIEFDVIFTAFDDGDIHFKWAQDTSDAGDLTCLRGSYLEVAEL